MGCDCDGIRRALVSPTVGTIRSDAISSGVAADGTVVGTVTLACASLCKNCIAEIVQGKLIEYAATTGGTKKITLDLYLFDSDTAYTASLNSALSLTAATNWENLVGVLTFSSSDYTEELAAGAGYLTFAYSDMELQRGYMKRIRTLLTQDLYGVLVNRSGASVDFGTNDLYVELFMEK